MQSGKKCIAGPKHRVRWKKIDGGRRAFSADAALIAVMLLADVSNKRREPLGCKTHDQWPGKLQKQRELKLLSCRRLLSNGT
jgi:hypothetical protein